LEGNVMQTAKEYREQLEWFWLFCQEEAWQEERQVDWQVVKTTTYGPTGPDGRYYFTIKVVANWTTEKGAHDYAADLNNVVAGPDEYYSVRKVEN